MTYPGVRVPRRTGSTLVAALISGPALDVGSASTAAGENFVVNGDFHSSMASWTFGYGFASATGSDVSGCSGSRSAKVYAEVYTDGGAEIKQCFATTGSDQIVQARAYTELDTVSLEAHDFASGDCTGAIGYDILESAQQGARQTLRFEVPEGTSSIRLFLRVITGSFEFVPTAYFDEVRSVSGDLVFLDDFEAASPCRWN